MLIKIYSVRDSKGEVFGPPIYLKTHGEAERNFTLLKNNPECTVNRFPEDFDLYYLGEFDDVKGTFDTLDTPQHICKAVQMPDMPQGAGRPNQPSLQMQ